MAIEEQHKGRIVVTGTPGVGKSVLYLDFFRRIWEHGGFQRIITAAFEDGTEKGRCVWVKDSDSDTSSYVLSQEVKQEQYDATTILLYDGVPPTTPSGLCFMVSFVCPNLGWIRRCRRKPTDYAVFYVPSWTYDELCDANRLLNLTTTNETILNRLQKFGGVARYILGDSSVESVGEQEISDALEKIETLDDVDQFFRQQGESEKIIHRLIHYDVKNVSVKPGLIPGSENIADQMHERIGRNLDSERAKLNVWLSGTSKSSTFLAWLFESFAHEQLEQGPECILVSLGQDKTETYKFGATMGAYKRFSTSVPLSDALRAAYRVPKNDNLRSIDSFKWDGGILWLFQITRNIDHPVDAEGILDLFEYLGQVDAFDGGTLRVKLVFVVQSELVSQQQFHVDDVFLPGKTDDEIMQSDCDRIPGIGSKKKRKLDDSGIRNVRQLVNMPQQHGMYSSCKQAVESFSKTLERRTTLQKICTDIPQYVTGLDYKSQVNA